MEEITLQTLLEAGCHFGHKAERWHPKAAQFIYTKKDGIHIIDLVKTKEGLEKACACIEDMIAKGGELLLVGTKRQATGIVKEEAQAVGAPYICERWIGGFLTNWEGIHKNIQKIIHLDEEQKNGSWKKYPKHEQLKLARYLARLKIFYGGVLSLAHMPTIIFIIDIKKESVAVREAVRTGIPIIAITDTNTNPTDIEYPIPANDDAVGSVSVITKCITQSYKQGKDLWQKAEAERNTKETEVAQVTPAPAPQLNEKDEIPVKIIGPSEKKKRTRPDETPVKRGRPRKEQSTIL